VVHVPSVQREVIFRIDEVICVIDIYIYIYAYVVVQVCNTYHKNSQLALIFANMGTRKTI